MNDLNSPKIALIVFVLGMLAVKGTSEDHGSLKLLHAEHVTQLSETEQRITSALSSLTGDAAGASEKAMVESLLARERQAVSVDDLKGNWKVRSIQVGRLGIFSYPFFQARVTDFGGHLFFEKTTGSQRKSGLLLRDSRGGIFFAGGWTVNEDPQ
ncbi:MAG: DUF4893 domain-containing protein, partial [Verrucomicrobiota bacterium]